MPEPDVAAQVAQFRESGWCLLENVVPPELIDAAREELLAARQVLQEDAAAIAWGEDETIEASPPDAAAVRERWPELARSPAPAGPHARSLLPWGGQAAQAQLCRCPVLSSCFSEPRLLAIARAVLNTDHVRVGQANIAPSWNTREDHDGDPNERWTWHSDWPHDLTAYSGARAIPRFCSGAVQQPFPDQTFALSVIFYLVDSTPQNGATWVVPRSRTEARNPRGPRDGLDEWSPMPDEIQVSAPAGSVLINDTRTFHSIASNFTAEPRVSAVLRFSPWWLGHEFGSPRTGGCQEWWPQENFERLSPEGQALFRHRACGQIDELQPPHRQRTLTARAELERQPAVQPPATPVPELRRESADVIGELRRFGRSLLPDVISSDYHSAIAAELKACARDRARRRCERPPCSLWARVARPFPGER